MTDAGVIERDIGLRPAKPQPAPLPLKVEAKVPGLRASLAQALEERRLFLLLPFALILGLIASTSVQSAPDPVALAAVGAAIAIGLPLAAGRLALLRLLVLAAAFWLGFSLLAIHGALFGTPMLAQPEFGTYTVTVDEVLSDGANGGRFIVSGIAPDSVSDALPIRRARLSLDSDIVLSTGDTVSGRFRFAPVPGPAVPGGFDAQFHGYFEGVGAYATAIGPVTRTSEGEATLPGRAIDSVRRAISARIDATLTQPAAGIARALITGDQSSVDEAARDTMATAGLAHVLSISGLHLTIVAGGIFAALRMALSFWTGLSRRISTKRLAAVAGIVSALLYFSISGGNVAALRATIMIVLVLGAVVVGRRALTMRNVAIAALLVILTDPASVFRPSFQLSFAAVVALIGAWEMSRGREGEERSLGRQVLSYGLGIVATSVVAGIATLLFSAYHFQQTSPLGVLGNLLSLPLVSFVMMPAAVLAVVFMPFGIEGPFLGAVGWSIDRMLDVARLVASLSGGLDVSPLLTPLALGIGLLALCWFAFFTSWWRLLGPVLAVPAVILFAVDRPPDVMISDTTQATAVRFANSMRLVTGRAGSFAVGVWEETYGGGPIEAVGESDPVRCDSIGCIVKSPSGYTLAVVDDPAAFFEDCSLVDAVITRITSPATCGAPLVIDAKTLAVRGVHWLRWTGDSFEVRPAIHDPGRAWRVPR